MIPSSVDPRRPDKVQRYKPPSTNGNASGEDLTPDYMNILGPETATANADGEKLPETKKSTEPIVRQNEEMPSEMPSSNTTNVIPTSPQYGVAITPNVIATESSSEIPTAVTDTLTQTTAKVGDETKDVHSTPSRNDRFKVVKIASLEPFKRGRWKCMDYVDEAPPPCAQIAKVPPTTTTNVQMYLQTQSLPQQHIQQMLLQGGYANAPHFFQTQVMPHTQYFYPAQGNMQQQQMMNATGVGGNTIPGQFINTTQTYFPAGMIPTSAGFTMPQNFQNVQYVTPNMLQNQNSAFVATSQMQQNFQQGQTYAGQPQQPMVNGHGFPPGEQQNAPNSLPTQAVKSVILNAAQTPVQGQSQTVPLQNQQQFGQMQGGQYQQPIIVQSTSQTTIHNQGQVSHVPQTTQNLQNSVYTNPQFVASVNSLPVLEGNAGGAPSGEAASEAVSSVETGEVTDDPAKTNPVVNAIDNKIEQAMDLVKSHLMYTVREEVEVLKEKIAELMERIQQLETENNFLRSQIPKNNQNQGGTPDPSTH